MTPIVWPIDELYGHGARSAMASWVVPIVHLNPFYHFAQFLRAPLIGQAVNIGSWFVATGITAGSLLVLFGQPLSKVARLIRDQVTGSAGNVRITLGAHPLEFPPLMDELVTELAANPRGHAALVRTDNHPWLFPVGFPAQPITARWTDRAGVDTATYAAEVALRTQSRPAIGGHR